MHGDRAAGWGTRWCCNAQFPDASEAASKGSQQMHLWPRVSRCKLPHGGGGPIRCHQHRHRGQIVVPLCLLRHELRVVGGAARRQPGGHLSWGRPCAHKSSAERRNCPGSCRLCPPPEAYCCRGQCCRPLPEPHCMPEDGHEFARGGVVVECVPAAHGLHVIPPLSRIWALM